MMNFFQRFAVFMQGRYGMDTLNKFLVGFCVFLWIVNIFVFNRIASMVISLLQLAILGLMIARMLSRNITMRSAENRTFVKVYDPAKNWVTLTWKKFKDRKDFRYIKCPMCRAQLRVRNKKGNHTVRCPRCGSEFDKKI